MPKQRWIPRGQSSRKLSHCHWPIQKSKKQISHWTVQPSHFLLDAGSTHCICWPTVGLYKALALFLEFVGTAESTVETWILNDSWMILDDFETFRTGRIMLLCQSCKGPSRHKWCLINRRGLCALYFLHCTTEQDCNTDNKTIWNILLRRPQNVALPKLQGSQSTQVVLDQSSRPLCFVLSTLYHRTRLQYWQQNNLKHTFAQAAECRFAKAARVPVDTSGAWSIVEAFVRTFYIVPQNKTAILTTKQFETYFCAGRRMSLCQSCKGPSRHKWCLINRRGLCALYFLHCTTEQDCNTDNKTIWNILLRRPQNVALPKLQGSQSTQVVLDQSSRPLCFVLSTLYHRNKTAILTTKQFETYFCAGRRMSLCQSCKGPSRHKWCLINRRGLCALYFLHCTTEQDCNTDNKTIWNILLRRPQNVALPKLQGSQSTQVVLGSIVEAFVLCTFYIVPQNKTAILTTKQFETYFCAGRRMSLCQSCKGPSRHKWCLINRRGLCALYFLHCTTEQDCNTDNKTIWNILLRRPQNVALPKLQGSQSTQVVLDQSSRPLCFVLSTLYHRTRLQYWQQNNLKHTFAQAAECRFAKVARVPAAASGALPIVEAFVLCTFYL